MKCVEVSIVKLDLSHIIGSTSVSRSGGVSSRKKTPDKTAVVQDTTPQDVAELGGAKPQSIDTSSPGILSKLRKATGKASIYMLLGVMSFQALAPSLAATVEQQLEPTDKIELLSEDHKLSSEQRDLASAEMDHLGSGAIRYLADQGVKLHITDNDAETAQLLVDHMHFDQVSQKEVQSVGEKVQTAVRKLNGEERVSQLSSRLDSLHTTKNKEVQKWFASMAKQRQEAVADNPGMQSMTGPLGGGGTFGGVGGMGGIGMLGSMTPGGMPDSVSSLGGEILDAQQMLTAEMNGQIEKAGISDLVRPAISVSPTISVESLVAMSGARTDQEKAEYRDLIYEWNGDNLVQAQTEALAKQESGLELVTNQAAREFFVKNLENVRNNPDRLPLATHKHN